jgi:hypothetical protein
MKGPENFLLYPGFSYIQVRLYIDKYVLFISGNLLSPNNLARAVSTSAIY